MSHPLTHLDEGGHARMVDVTEKSPTVRAATAAGAGLHAAQDLLVHAHVLHRDLENALRALHLEISLDRAQGDGDRAHRARRSRQPDAVVGLVVAV